MASDSVIGNESSVYGLTHAMRGRSRGAFLLRGPEGVGKSIVARRAAMVPFCLWPQINIVPPCRDCANCKRIHNQMHPDVLFLSDKDGIAGVRRIKATLQLAPYDGGARVIIVDNVDRLSPEARDALLKQLEEPGDQTYYLLVAHRRVSETLESRCALWTFNPLTAEEMKSVAAQWGVPELAPLGEGRPGRLKKLIADGAASAVDRFNYFASKVRGGSRPVEFLTWVDSLTAAQYDVIVDQFVLREVTEGRTTDAKRFKAAAQRARRDGYADRHVLLSSLITFVERGST